MRKEINFMKPLFFTKKYVILIMLVAISTICSAKNMDQYSKEEIEIAKTISMEACSEGYTGMYAVSNVIKNRSIKYNKTPFDIVSQKNQFVGYTHKNRDKRFKECEKDSLFLATNIMKLKDITHNGLYFKTKNEKKQKWHNVKTITIKNHEFYR